MRYVPGIWLVRYGLENTFLSWFMVTIAFFFESLSSNTRIWNGARCSGSRQIEITRILGFSSSSMHNESLNLISHSGEFFSGSILFSSSLLNSSELCGHAFFCQMSSTAFVQPTEYEFCL